MYWQGQDGTKQAMLSRVQPVLVQQAPIENVVGNGYH
jgi:hypothetical protein